jgi:DNA-directed RNA polymerase specialized sigma subunit
MIRNEKEYKEAIRRLEQNKVVIQKQEEELKKHNLSKEEIKRALDPMRSFHQQLAEEVEWYKKVKRKHFETITNLNEVGRLLIALRIASGLSQNELAKRSGVPESQVSRDERNEYHGISLERAQKILSIFGVHVKAKVEIERSLERKEILAGLAR